MLFLVCLLLVSFTNCDEFSAGEAMPEMEEMAAMQPVRYLMYEVNYGEGFNLRRDVYLRMANMVKSLNDEEGQAWVLVLPPWGRIYHWKSPIPQNIIPWSRFFDVDSLRAHAPVIEMEDWRKVVSKDGLALVNEMYYLQPYKEGWKDGKWTERYELRDCNDRPAYIQDRASGHYRGHFWGYNNEEVRAASFSCVSVQAEYTTFKQFLKATTGRSVMLHRAESLIHGKYSEWSKEWWTARRSVRYSKQLINIADRFRFENLDSDDESDGTAMDKDWRTQRRELGSATGGPYMAVHLRRRDFLYGHRDHVPSLEFAAKQILETLKSQQLSKLYVATDAPTEEYEELVSLLPDVQVYRFVPDEAQLVELGDGGVAIIDQWICAHARYFVGTSASTFSTRINEERSLLGLGPDTTYNRVCGDEEDKDKCASSQPGRWFPNYA